jgi:predicted permease
MTMLSKISADAGNRSAALAGIALMLIAIWMFSFGDALGSSSSRPTPSDSSCARGASLVLLSPAIWQNRAAFRPSSGPVCSFSE